MYNQVCMLIGYKSGSFVGAVPQFESPSQCAQTAASGSVCRSGSSVGAFLPLGTTALGEPWPPHHPISIAVFHLLYPLLYLHYFQVCYNIIKSDFQTSFVIICFICFSSFQG